MFDRYTWKHEKEMSKQMSYNNSFRNKAPYKLYAYKSHTVDVLVA